MVYRTVIDMLFMSVLSTSNLAFINIYLKTIYWEAMKGMPY